MRTDAERRRLLARLELEHDSRRETVHAHRRRMLLVVLAAALFIAWELLTK